MQPKEPVGRLPPAIVAVTLSTALCRHLRLDRLQLRVMVLLWLPHWRRLRLRLLRRLLSPHSGKVRPGCEGDLLVAWQRLRQVRAVGDDNPLIGHKAGNAIVVAENLAGDLFSGVGSANMMVQRLFTDLPQVFECGSNGLRRPGSIASSMTCFITRLDGSFVVSIDASIMRGLVITEKSISWPYGGPARK